MISSVRFLRVSIVEIRRLTNYNDLCISITIKLCYFRSVSFIRAAGTTNAFLFLWDNRGKRFLKIRSISSRKQFLSNNKLKYVKPISGTRFRLKYTFNAAINIIKASNTVPKLIPEYNRPYHRTANKENTNTNRIGVRIEFVKGQLREIICSSAFCLQI